MKSKKLSLAIAAVGIAGVAIAHHIPVALSYVFGSEILSEIDVYMHPNNFGAPAYVVADEEHDHDIQLASGDSFTVTTPAGTERVVFDAAQFADIGHATDDEVVDAVNAQITGARFESQNGFLLARGLQGGTSAALGIDDGGNGTLAKLHFIGQTQVGAVDLVLQLSIPDPQIGLENQQYLMLVSTLPGSFVRHGQTIPLGLDPSLRKFLTATGSGQLPGFVGTLDANADATATLPLGLVPSILGTHDMPSELYVAYLVFSPDHQSIVYVSNLFTIHVH